MHRMMVPSCLESCLQKNAWFDPKTHEAWRTLKTMKWKWRMRWYYSKYVTNASHKVKTTHSLISRPLNGCLIYWVSLAKLFKYISAFYPEIEGEIIGFSDKIDIGWQHLTPCKTSYRLILKKKKIPKLQEFALSCCCEGHILILLSWINCWFYYDRK